MTQQSEDNMARKNQYCVVATMNTEKVFWKSMEGCLDFCELFVSSAKSELISYFVAKNYDDVRSAFKIAGWTEEYL